MLAVELEFSNTTDSALGPISVGSPRLPVGMEMKAIGEIPQIPPGNSLSMTVGINFNDSLQVAKFDIWWVGGATMGRGGGWYAMHAKCLPTRQLDSFLVRGTVSQAKEVQACQMHVCSGVRVPLYLCESGWIPSVFFLRSVSSPL